MVESRRPKRAVSQPKPGIEGVEARVAEALERAGYVDNGTLLVVAVSGGPDSMALLYCMVTLRESRGIRLHVAHLNHNFREEADEDARFVAAVARRLEVPASVGKADPTAYQREMGISSFEEAAREVRYRYLTKVASDISAAAVALGHTSDDLAESVLMHILRGSGIHGLKGMDELATWSDRVDGPVAILFRPLLGVNKRDTEDYCKKLGIDFKVDPANRLLRFTRNRLRHDLLPELESYNPRVREALSRLSRSASLVTDLLDREVDGHWPEIAQRQSDDLYLDSTRLETLHPLVQRMVLRRAYREQAGDTRRLGEVHLSAMEELINAAPGKMLTLPKGLWLHRSYGRLILSRRETPPCPFPKLEGVFGFTLPHSGVESAMVIPGWRISARFLTSQALPDHPYEAALDATSVGDIVQIRGRVPGDRFQPLGMSLEKKLQDFYVDEKVPRAWRDRIPLVVTERGIAWVVGYRVAEWARARLEQDDGREFLRVRFDPTSLRDSRSNLPDEDLEEAKSIWAHDLTADR